jgi:hypothetical protein
MSLDWAITLTFGYFDWSSEAWEGISGTLWSMGIFPSRKRPIFIKCPAFKGGKVNRFHLNLDCSNENRYYLHVADWSLGYLLLTS